MNHPGRARSARRRRAHGGPRRRHAAPVGRARGGTRRRAPAPARGCGPRTSAANVRAGAASRRAVVTSMVLGDEVQVVARLEGGPEMLARQSARRATEASRPSPPATASGWPGPSGHAAARRDRTADDRAATRPDARRPRGQSRCTTSGHPSSSSWSTSTDAAPICSARSPAGTALERRRRPGSLASYLAGCGGTSTGSSGGDDAATQEDRSQATPDRGPAADRQLGRLLRPRRTTRATRRSSGRRSRSRATAPTTSCSPSSRRRLEVRRRRADGLRGHEDDRPEARARARPTSCIPNLKNLEDAFTKVEYDPGNKYSVPKDYGITRLLLGTDIVTEQPTTMKDGVRACSTPKFRKLKVNFLEGSTQVVGIALGRRAVD